VAWLKGRLIREGGEDRRAGVSVFMYGILFNFDDINK
jgi:hypothetical protein